MPSRATAESQPSLFTEGQIHSSALKQKRDRRKVLLWFLAYLQGTADECAEGLGMDRLAIRPRTTELVNDGCLVKREDLPRKSSGKGGTSGVLEITQIGKKELRG